MKTSELSSVCVIGFGEVGVTIVNAIQSVVKTVVVYDNQFVHANSKPCQNLKTFNNLVVARNTQDIPNNIDLFISTVTAEQAYDAAKSCMPVMKSGTWYWDLNSVSPTTKCKLDELVVKHGGRFIEGAIMSPINPAGIKSPVLIGGAYAESFLSVAKDIGFSNSQFCDRQVGKAAATKMCRSVMIKGIEALLSESLIAARFYGVEKDVIQSLNNLMPGVDWNEHSAYMISRSLIHGVRRAEEMREAAKTVAATGIQPHMSSASAKTQEWVAGLELPAESMPIDAMLDAMLEKIGTEKPKATDKPFLQISESKR